MPDTPTSAASIPSPHRPCYQHSHPSAGYCHTSYPSHLIKRIKPVLNRGRWKARKLGAGVVSRREGVQEGKITFLFSPERSYSTNTGAEGRGKISKFNPWFTRLWLRRDPAECTGLTRWLISPLLCSVTKATVWRPVITSQVSSGTWRWQAGLAELRVWPFWAGCLSLQVKRHHCYRPENKSAGVKGGAGRWGQRSSGSPTNLTLSP